MFYSFLGCGFKIASPSVDNNKNNGLFRLRHIDKPSPKQPVLLMNLSPWLSEAALGPMCCCYVHSYRDDDSVCIIEITSKFLQTDA